MVGVIRVAVVDNVGKLNIDQLTENGLYEARAEAERLIEEIDTRLEEYDGE